MNASELNELAGRIEGMGRVLLNLVATLEEAGVINGQAFTDELRRSIVLGTNPNPLMPVAKVTVEHAANALDEARKWRRFRRQVAGKNRRSGA